jgi:hypothetical protein
LANAGVNLQGGGLWASSIAHGALLGLVVGKPVGIIGATWLAIRLGVAPRPTGSSWGQLFGVGLMAGVGFTMSLLIGNLGLGHTRSLEEEAKFGVLGASLISAVLGLAVLARYRPVPNHGAHHDNPVVLDVPRFARGYGVKHCPVQGALVDRTLSELDVRRRFGVSVIGVWRGHTSAPARNLEPLAADDVMRDGDVLLVAGADRAVDEFLAFSGSQS